MWRDEKGMLLVGVGSTIWWTTLGGIYYEGVIVEMDSNVAFVKVQDGTIKPVEL